jgi:hypothetical protein
MKLITIFLCLLLLATPVLAYDYDDGTIQLEMFPNGDWLIFIGNNIYAIQQIDGKQKTTGTDGTCYWFNGVEFTNC